MSRSHRGHIADQLRISSLSSNQHRQPPANLRSTRLKGLLDEKLLERLNVPYWAWNTAVGTHYEWCSLRLFSSLY
jgi:hypothetical protein